MFARLIPIMDNIIRPLYQYGSDASLFWTWMIAMAGSQAILNHKLNKRVRYALFVLLVVSVYVALVQAYSWKSGWLPALAGLFVIAWLALPRFRMALVILAGFVLVMNSVVKVEQVVVGGEDYSILTRLEAWRIILEIVKVNPLLGLGLSNYYWYTQLFPILGYSVKFNSHNNYVDIIAQVGLIGLACFMWFMWEVGRLGLELRHEAKEGFQYAFVIGVLGGLAGTLIAGMLGDWLLPFVYNVGLHGYRSSVFFWLFLGGLVALEQIIRKPKNKVPAE
jgi:O-antigen ligase